VAQNSRHRVPRFRGWVNRRFACFMIRVIAGTLGGRWLRTKKGLSTRPTSERVRAALFNIVGPLLPEHVVWDLCAGSGALGIEALSRGAGQAWFVESDKGACHLLRKNLEELKIADGNVVIEATLDHFVRKGVPKAAPAHLLLADPPYESDALLRLIEAMGKDPGRYVRKDGRVVFETTIRKVDEIVQAAQRGSLECHDVRKYGDTALLFFLTKQTD